MFITTISPSKHHFGYFPISFSKLCFSFSLACNYFLIFFLWFLPWSIGCLKMCHLVSPQFHQFLAFLLLPVSKSLSGYGQIPYWAWICGLACTVSCLLLRMMCVLLGRGVPDTMYVRVNWFILSPLFPCICLVVLSIIMSGYWSCQYFLELFLSQVLPAFASLILMVYHLAYRMFTLVTSSCCTEHFITYNAFL